MERIDLGLACCHGSQNHGCEEDRLAGALLEGRGFTGYEFGEDYSKGVDIGFLRELSVGQKGWAKVSCGRFNVIMINMYSPSKKKKKKGRKEKKKGKERNLPLACGDSAGPTGRPRP